MKTVKTKPETKIYDYSTCKIERRLVSVDEFLYLPPYIMNRDVSSRIDGMVRRLKEGPKPTHLMASIGIALNDFGKYKKGDVFKFDGNTRTEVWKMRPNISPNVPLFVTVYYVSSKEEADAIYYDIDSSQSVEKSNDKVTGLLREREYTAVSSKIRKGTFKTAIMSACEYADNENGICMSAKELNYKFEVKLDFFWNELVAIDQMNLDDLEKYSGNVLAALLLVAKKWGHQNPRFKLLFENLRDGVTTVSTSTEMDGVHFVQNDLYNLIIDSWKDNSYSNAKNVIAPILYGFDMFMKNENIQKKKKTLPLTPEKFRRFLQEYLR